MRVAALKEGKKIAAIVATMGTTDAFGLDDLDAIAEIRDQLESDFALDYKPHVHADAVIGWAWSVFNDYDFRANPLGFPHRTVWFCRHSAATSRVSGNQIVGIDFHKTGFTPSVSSLFLLLFRRFQADCPRRRDDAVSVSIRPLPSRKEHSDTMCSGAAPMAALANLLLFGKDGLRSLLGHLVTMAESLRNHLNGQSGDDRARTGRALDW